MNKKNDNNILVRVFNKCPHCKHGFSDHTFLLVGALCNISQCVDGKKYFVNVNDYRTKVFFDNYNLCELFIRKFCDGAMNFGCIKEIYEELTKEINKKMEV